MTEARERVCVGCGDSEEQGRLESCSICNRAFCPECAHRAFSRRFCSSDCARAYWFAGESDDDDQDYADD